DDIYFSTSSTLQVKGPGRLEVEAGGDLYIPAQNNGIQTGWITYASGTPWRTDYDAADIAISVGFNQTPDYAAFEARYLDPSRTGGAPDYILEDLGDGRRLSIYLVDQIYERAGGPNQAFPTERREGLVNYVRRLQGKEPLQSRQEQLAY